MTKNILFILSLLIGCIGFGQELTLDWAKQFSSKTLDSWKVHNNPEIIDLVVDSLGNSYCVGHFSQEYDINPDPSINISLISNGTSDVFIQKIDSKGNLIWYYQYGDTEYDYVYSIFLDEFDNLFVTGTKKHKTYILKFSKNGNLIKEYIIDEFSDNYVSQSGGKSISVNNSNEIIVGGYYYGSVDFDNSDSINKLTSYNNNINGFVLKLNSDFEFMWVQSIGDTYSEIEDIVIDKEENLYCLTRKQYSISISKINSNGEFNYQKNIYGNNISAHSISIFQNKYLYLSGQFNNTIDLDPSESIYNLTSRYFSNGDLFLAKYDLDLNVQWAKNSQLASYTPIAIDNLRGELYFVDYKSGFDISKTYNDTFVWGANLSGKYSKEISKIFYFKDQLFVVGKFKERTNLDYNCTYGDLISTNIGYTASRDNLDVFIAKYKLCLNKTNNIYNTECNNYYWNATNLIYNETGIYVANLKTSLGCDSIVTLNLSIKKSTSSSINESVCSSYLAPNGQILTSSGIYTIVILNKVGCDSVIILNLKVRKPTNSIISQVVCDSYKAPNGQTFTNSGTYLVIIPNKAGCDSVITINLTVNKKTFNTINQTSCDSYLGSDNITYSKSGIYTIVIPNKQGCDSVITLNLTINKLVLKVPNDTSICQGNSIILRGLNTLNTIWNNGVTDNTSFIPTKPDTYTAYGTDINGCKDTANVKVDFYPNSTISLINNNPTIICEGQKFTLYTSSSNINQYYWFRNGELLQNQIKPFLIENTSGNYFVRGVSMNGCSKISDTLNFIISTLPSIKAGENKIICTGEKVKLKASNASNYTWSNGIQNGDTISPTLTTKYIVETQDEKGCKNKDSLTITVLQTSESTISLSSAEPFILNGITYKETGTYYQKLKNSVGCDSTIILNLVVENLNNLTENIFQSVTIYPNPIVNDKIQISIPTDIFTVSIYDSEGKFLSNYYNSKEVNLSSYSKGLYWVEIQSDSVVRRFKIIYL